MKLSLSVPSGFSFWHTVYSHGWCSLPPFTVDRDNKRLRRIVELSDGKPRLVEVHQHSAKLLAVDIPQEYSLPRESQREIGTHIAACLRLNEDLGEFYREARRHPQFRWIPTIGAGRLLRAPTVFEDVVKMICTTNCSWALTEIMIGNLCEKLGTRLNETHHTFPQPGAIADRTESFLRKEIRAGYRAPYLLELSRRIVSKKIDIESWRYTNAPTDELFQEVRSVKGVGPYAAGNILKLLGRYDYLGIDSWCRKQFFEKHKNGRTTTDKAIERFYASFGRWKGLFFWLDVTKPWYNKQFPF